MNVFDGKVEGLREALGDEPTGLALSGSTLKYDCMGGRSDSDNC